jgi:hypothetical protein
MSNIGYSIEQLDNSDINPSTSTFMAEACRMISSCEEVNKPLAMMGIINALAYLVDDDNKMEAMLQASSRFTYELLMLNMHKVGSLQ